jgi:glycosyltransferase involved in cell wall biosynthesis
MLTWNRKSFLELNLNSFFQNISSNIEFQFIILDNGSTDGTVELLRAREQMDARIKVIYNKRNKGLNEYKRLLNMCKNDYIVIVDDDVIEFPPNFDQQMVSYMETFTDFGFVALDVVQNEHTNGAKPDETQYVDLMRDGLTISQGPAGGWCVIMRRRDYSKIRLRFNLGYKLDMSKGEDGKLSYLMRSKLNLKSGVMKGIRCFHASGPYYSKMFGCMDRDLMKFKEAKLDQFVALYKDFDAGSSQN